MHRKKYESVDTYGVDNNTFYSLDEERGGGSIIFEDIMNNTLTTTTESESADKGKIKSQLILMLTSFICSVVVGIGVAFTSPFLNNLIKMDLLNNKTSPMYTSFLTIGCIFGGPLAGKFSNKYGRKPTIILIILLMTYCWFLTIISEYFPIRWAYIVLYLSRFLIGCALSMILLILPVYMNECIHERIRGTFGYSIGLGISFGILTTYLVGSFISWQYTSMLAILMLVPAILFTLYIPESPRWLIRHNEVDKSMEVLMWLRNSKQTAIEEQNKILHSLAVQNKTDGFWSKFRTIKNPYLLKNIMACLCIHAIQQFSLINVFISYSSEIFITAGYTNTQFPLIFIGFVQMLSSIFSAFFIDRFGRRPLILISSVLVILSLMSMGFYFHLKSFSILNDSHTWIIVLFVSFYIISFCMGINQIPWIMLSELLISNIQDELCSIVTLINRLISLFVVLSYPYLTQITSKYNILYIFAVLCSIILSVVVFTLPETKNICLEDIKKKNDSKD
ncbi:hypothetical protein A3Q56_00314 [Intoshia linei]|uniref:Major facilitator superfamily (MFS) profile domain-containing protein n=1 Tax=Intoshia linei TaxID=1819745 RepID=A0A177BCJ3_9BILA|nr:hypothetical protein A3Q56_00314 [Intoshia linei]